jgi:hypothetical protein
MQDARPPAVALAEAVVAASREQPELAQPDDEPEVDTGARRQLLPAVDGLPNVR